MEHQQYVNIYRRMKQTAGGIYYPVGSDCFLYQDYGDDLESASDHSSGGNDGSISGAVFANSGLSFDGIDDFVNVVKKANQQIVSAMSYYIWIKPTSCRGAWDGFLGKLTTGSWGAGYGARFLTSYNEGDSIGLFVNGYSGGTIAFHSSDDLSPSSSLGHWSFFAGTWDKSDGSGEMRVYYDSHVTGLVQEAIYSGGAPNAYALDTSIPDVDLTIGRIDTADYDYNGIVGQILLFNVKKTLEDINDFFDFTKARYSA